MVNSEDAIKEFMGSLDCAGWTEEQWAEHDAKMAAAREKRDPPAGPFAKRAARMRELGWPLRAIESALGADEKRVAISAVRAWDVSDRNVIVLQGPPGCGKTVAGAWWGLRHTVSPTFVKMAAFARSQRYSEERATILAAPALVLDDLGAEYQDGKDLLVADLDELVDAFYGDKRPLIVTTNLSGKLFGERYGARIVDRCRECGTWVPLGDVPSMRRKAGAV